MAEYIDRGVIVHALMNIPNTPKQTFDVVCNAPAADVVPVVHGRWEPRKDVPGFVRCSACKGCNVYDEWQLGQ